MKITKNNILPWTLFWLLLTTFTESPAEEIPVISSEKSTNSRFVRIGQETKSKGLITSPTPVSCVFDNKTSLIWEVKTRDRGLRDARQSYSWYDSNAKSNGGFQGYRNRGKCAFSSCDTDTYISYVNKIKLCGRSDWRLPAREELRSLVDYQVTYPGPTIDQNAFPNTISQFYWSATANANDKETAWGIGFSFGYDYAYFKSDHGYIRLVSGPK